MPNKIIFIPEAYALSVHNAGHEPAPLIISTDSISAVIPWDVGFESADYIGGFTGYLLLVRGYYDHHNQRFNIEKYEISKSVFEYLCDKLSGARKIDEFVNKLKEYGFKNQEDKSCP